MHRIASLALAALVFPGLFACQGSDPLWGEDGPLLVDHRPDTLVLVNELSTHPVGVAVVVEGALVTLTPCVAWTPIPPGQARTIPHEQVIAWSDQAEALEIHWCVQPAGRPSGTLRVPI